MLQKPLLTPKETEHAVIFDRDQCIQLGQSLHTEYVNNDPFPSIVIDSLLPLSICRRVVDEFPKWMPGRFNEATSQKKTGYQMEAIESDYITNLLNALNSSQFLAFLETLTGIDGLIPDPHYMGGGLHETIRGGHLSIHADFNVNTKLNLERRLNLILFLNENWNPEYGGDLELWDTSMTKCVHAVRPEISTAVIFNTNADSFHGHPAPLESPDGVARRSIALYYYTSVGEDKLPPARTTNFRKRPGSGDAFRRSFRESLRYFARDWVPPRIMRALDRK